MEYEKITDAEKFASALTELRIEYLTEDYGGLSLTELEQLREKLPHYFQTHLNVDLFAYVCRAGGLLQDAAFCSYRRNRRIRPLSTERQALFSTFIHVRNSDARELQADL